MAGQADTIVEVLEALGPNGGPPYRVSSRHYNLNVGTVALTWDLQVRSENGHETLINPGPDSVVKPAEDSVSQESTTQ